MADLLRTDSIVADSTISLSSPPHVIPEASKDDDSTFVDSKLEPQVPTKRVCKTYGRPKPKGNMEDVAHDDLGSRARILRTAPRDADNQVVPESDDEIETLPEFTGFAWRDQLKAIDKGLDIPGNGEASHQRESITSIIVDDPDASDMRREFSGINETINALSSSVASGDPMQLESLFDGSLSSLLSSEPTPSSQYSALSSNLPDKDGLITSRPKQSSTSHKQVIDTPEASESDDNLPQQPYFINSPKRQSSSTPPTSPLAELGLQESVVHSGASTKVPKKGNCNGKRKERGNKALTKKEVTEMRKESARLLAERHVCIERTYARSALSIGRLFEKLKPLPTTSKSDSDPIVPFSSPGNKFQSFPGNSDTDDDLELEIVLDPSRENKTKRSQACSREQRAITNVDGMKITSKPSRISPKNLQEAAKPAFVLKKGPSRQRGQEVSFSQRELNDLLLQRADRQGGEIEESKKEQWVKRGGVLKEHRRPETEEKLMTDWLIRGTTHESAMEIDEEEGDSDDPEYEPGVIEGHKHEESDIEPSESEAPDDAPASQQRMVTSDEGDDADKENHRPIPRRQTARTIMSSDDEEEPMSQPRSGSHRVIVPGTSLADDSPGGDKENSAELAFSFGENKENEEVPRHTERGRVVDTEELNTSEFMAALSAAPGSSAVGNSKTSREPLGRLDVEAELAFVPEALTQRRDTILDRALQVLHEEDKDATLAPTGPMDKGALHRRSSSTSSELDNFNEPTLISPIGFSQLFGGDRVEGPAPCSVLGAGGFSQFFSQSGDNGHNSCATPLKVREPLSQPQTRPAPAKDDNFEFTQPNALLPSIKLSESQRREVDEMFGKDQEFKLDEAKQSKKQSQHTTSSASNKFHFGSFVPSPIAQTPRSLRRPLETLSLEGRCDDTLPDESPQTQPIRHSRLLRERPQAHLRTSLSPPSVPRNAFDVLRDAASKSKRERRSKPDIGKSEFIEAEAEESDEEAMLGFGGAKGKDDEEGGNEDPNMVVENLVDDRILDETAQAADLVLQKHMEHQAADDAALEKLHQDAVDGKLRGKRRDRGIGLDSDSDDDDDDDGSSRKPLYKKRRVDGDTLEAYARDPTTLAFYNTYHVGLTEPDESLDIGNDGENSREDRSDDGRTEVVDPIKVKRQIIDDKSNEGKHWVQRSSSPELDPDNASWVDSDDQDIGYMDNVRVENGPLHPRKATTSAHAMDHVGYRGGFEGKKTCASEERQLKTWASQESRAHTSATGRGGFSRKDSASGSSSRRQGKLAPMRDATGDERKVLVKQSSLISHVEKRNGFNG